MFRPTKQTISGQQDIGRAGRLYGAAERLRELKAVPLLPLDRTQNERCYQPLRHLFEDQAFVEWRGEGRALELQQMLTLALEAPALHPPH